MKFPVFLKVTALYLPRLKNYQTEELSAEQLSPTAFRLPCSRLFQSTNFYKFDSCLHA